MTHTIQPITDYVAGDSIEVVFDVTSSDIDTFEGVTAEWWLLDSKPQTAVSAADLTADSYISSAETTGVSVDVDSTSLTITLTIDPNVTGTLAGTQYQILRAEGDTQGRETWGGKFHIDQP